MAAASFMAGAVVREDVTADMGAMNASIERAEKRMPAIFDVGLLNKEEQDTLAQLGEIGKTPETLKKSADMHSELLLHEVGLIETLAKNTLKILAAMVFALSAGGLISLIFTIATQQRL